MEFGQKIFRQIDLFDFTSVLVWTFFNFLSHCGGVGKYCTRNIIDESEFQCVKRMRPCPQIRCHICYIGMDFEIRDIPCELCT